MARHEQDNAIHDALKALEEDGLDGMGRAIELLLNEAMKAERSAHLGAGLHERSDGRRGYANGYKPKALKSRLGRLELRIPQVRDAEEPFYPKSLEKGLRSERALKLAVAEMYLKGVSTRKVKAITEQLCGLDLSSTEVSRIAAELDEKLEAWRTRQLGEVRHLILDASYEKARHGGHVRDSAVLLAKGVLANGKRSLLGVSVSMSEAEQHWREFLESLQVRGMHGVRTVTSDDHKGLRAALQSRLTGVPWQRCQFHLQQNAGAYVPRVSMRKEVARDIRGVFNSQDLGEAREKLARLVEKYRDSAPRLASWAEENLPEGLTVLDPDLGLSDHARRRLRTTNGLERLHKEVKRRTRVVSIFPSEASLLRLVTATVVEISDEWEAGRAYITMEDQLEGGTR